ncbi:MAG: FkbM family methyltransferase [Verrucomicrobia bacterium]|nr:FkbM family methyltransferase [Verrucomicrobiota bacterium]MBS0646034.1 FkbM family methyltransferase [Verrucomicrobiota bacterium]
MQPSHSKFVNFLKALLQGERLYLADVGATGGPETRWQQWESLCFFYTFDPDPRSQLGSCASKNYPLGLWSGKDKKTLYLAEHPPASSLFKPNQEVLNSFAASKALQQQSSSWIELDSLDHVLDGQSLDFIKIDAEGAELEILKGAQQSL